MAKAKGYAKLAPYNNLQTGIHTSIGPDGPRLERLMPDGTIELVPTPEPPPSLEDRLVALEERVERRLDDETLYE